MGKKAGKKSARASGMAAAISGSLQRNREVTTTDDDSDQQGPLCFVCNHDEGYEDHFKPSPNYHEFQPGKSAASSAPPPSEQATAATGD